MQTFTLFEQDPSGAKLSTIVGVLSDLIEQGVTTDKFVGFVQKTLGDNFKPTHEHQARQLYESLAPYWNVSKSISSLNEMTPAVQAVRDTKSSLIREAFRNLAKDYQGTGKTFLQALAVNAKPDYMKKFDLELPVKVNKPLPRPGT